MTSHPQARGGSSVPEKSSATQPIRFDRCATRSYSLSITLDLDRFTQPPPRKRAPALSDSRDCAVPAVKLHDRWWRSVASVLTKYRRFLRQVPPVSPSFLP